MRFASRIAKRLNVLEVVILLTTCSIKHVLQIKQKI